MENTEQNHFSSAESLTQVASWFQLVENAVSPGDTNKRYTISSHAANGPGCPFREGEYTSIIISPTGDNMCDLYNSFINVDMDLTIMNEKAVSSSTLQGINAPAVWVGYKDAMDSIAAYQIVCNGNVIYTQNNAIEESYITACGATEAVKKVDVFSKARHKDIWDRVDTVRSGAIFEYGDSNVPNTKKTKRIQLKIDYRRFLPLASLKYIPEFLGTVELRIKFSSEGLVHCPLSIKDCLRNNPALINRVVSYPEITNKYVQIGEDFVMFHNVREVQNATTKINEIYITELGQRLKVDELKIESCFSNTACFGLDPNIMLALVQRYSQEPFTVPIQTLTFQTMNGTVHAKELHSEIALTTTPRFVDTIFILFPKHPMTRTVYENPLFTSIMLGMGGYGTIPSHGCKSNDQMFYELCANALNVNNDLTGFNSDVMKSLTCTEITQKGFVSNDITNFFMAFPTETDNTFQQGMTSNTPITFRLTVEQSATSPFYDKESSVVRMGFLKDSVFAAQVRQGAPPIVQIDEFDITSQAQ